MVTTTKVNFSFLFRSTLFRISALKSPDVLRTLSGRYERYDHKKLTNCFDKFNLKKKKEKKQIFSEQKLLISPGKIIGKGLRYVPPIEI